VSGLCLLERHVRPSERSSTQQHVPDKRLDRCFADKAYKEQLFDDMCRDGTQRWQSQQQLAEAGWLAWVLSLNVVLQCALRFLLDRLDVRRIRQTACVYRKQFNLFRDRIS